MQRTESVELTVLCLIHQNDKYLLQNRLKDEMYNADFNTAAYEEIMSETGLNRFIMSDKQWVSCINII